ncbi:hypothetical protein [Polymorphobacter megasporae]|uniref:hypothetical protein n=1 Tax=Glacieibacterium megasporae TaxID=2835787 RepID=UPI001C1E82C3|nr:hypothetical protein [Polymorphobacter megasporae]UAJ11447.1 hypothetical protein KTC28_07125 [Polymorphobacter megasporae]
MPSCEVGGVRVEPGESDVAGGLSLGDEFDVDPDRRRGDRRCDPARAPRDAGEHRRLIQEPTSIRAAQQAHITRIDPEHPLRQRPEELTAEDARGPPMRRVGELRGRQRGEACDLGLWQK